MGVIISLADATTATCGGKAATLATLLRHGLPVPDGFVVPFPARRAHEAAAERRLDGPNAEPRPPERLRSAIAEGLSRMGDPVVAVRSSAANEDGPEASAAGQYASVLGVRGEDAVVEAIHTCRRSAGSARATGYWSRRHRNATSSAVSGRAEMAVLVQRLVAADTAGVMFTPVDAGHGTRIEAAWGLGSSVVAGTVTPDTYERAPDGTVTHTIGGKLTRTDRSGDALVTRSVPVEHQTRPTLTGADVADLAALGTRVAALLGGALDIEWAIRDGRIWILQARPVTAALPPRVARTPTPGDTDLVGSPGSHGVATGPARVLRGPSDFARVRPGDIIVCPYTDPSWTPLFGIAAGVVTETGGALSHAAIVAREHGIPAVLGVPDATTRVHDTDPVTIDGTAGRITVVAR